MDGEFGVTRSKDQSNGMQVPSAQRGRRVKREREKKETPTRIEIGEKRRERHVKLPVNEKSDPNNSYLLVECFNETRVRASTVLVFRPSFYTEPVCLMCAFQALCYAAKGPIKISAIQLLASCPIEETSKFNCSLPLAFSVHTFIVNAFSWPHCVCTEWHHVRKRELDNNHQQQQQPYEVHHEQFSLEKKKHKREQSRELHNCLPSFIIEKEVMKLFENQFLSLRATDVRLLKMKG